MNNAALNRIKQSFRKGFTLAETLAVVAIIAVLAMAGIVGISTYQRKLHQLKMDTTAKEVFVAAQNHLSMAGSQGFLGRTGFGTSETEEGAEEDSGVFYFIVPRDDPDSGTSVLNLMMPFASIDETVRSGNYVIRYQKKPAIVMDVFYAEKTGRFSHEFVSGEYSSLISNYRGPEHKSDRLRYQSKCVIGYYGGETANEIETGDTIYDPDLEIINADKLQAIVRDDPRNEGRCQLKLVITGKTSGQKKEIVLIDENGTRVTDSGVPVAYDFAGNSFTVTLDDVTASDAHFAQMFPDFIPGEDLSIKAVAFNNTVFTNVGESAEKETNSLYAAVTDKVMEVSNFRHLENLDAEISGLNLTGLSIQNFKAKQTTDLTWGETGSLFGSTVRVYPLSGDASAAGTFLPVCPSVALAYDGLEHSITDLKIQTADDAGLFGALLNGSSVKDLELADFTVKSTAANAGALVGTMTGTSVSGVLVRNANTKDDSNEEITAKKSAGGLAGVMNGGSVELSAAAVYVQSTSETAGGLIGTVTTTAKITNSYSAGHTVTARYTDIRAGRGRVNVIGVTNAGGLVGSATGSAFEISYCYSTCSTYGKNPAGFIANAEGGTIGHTYCTGRVIGSTSDPSGPFVGKRNGTQFTGENYYLTNVSTNLRDDIISGITGVSGKDTSVTAFIVPENQRKSAVTYDRTLMTTYLGKFYFPTIDQLNAATVSKKEGITDRHIGDWQVPNLDTLDFIVWNDDTLRTAITLEENTKQVMLAVSGEASGNTKVFLFNTTDRDNVTIAKIGYVENNRTIHWQPADEDETKARKIPVWVADDVLTVKLDDITKQDIHFKELFASSPNGDAANLIPGENIKIRVGKDEASWTELLETEAQLTNSLFETGSTALGEANLTYVRHLQNLDPKVSDVDGNVTKATVEMDIDWAEVHSYPAGVFTDYSTIYTLVNDGTETVTGSFYALYNPSISVFDGGSLKLKNFVINGAPSSVDSNGAGNAGLFRLVDNGMTVKDLKFENTAVTADSGKNAGTVAADVDGNGITMRTVLAVADSRAVSGENAGGLVGRSTADMTVYNCAASVLVNAAGGAAGGLNGLQAGGSVKMEKSFAGGHTDSRKYSTSDYNVTSESAPAGGITGEVRNGQADYKEVFSAASVQSGIKSAGGIIGQAQVPVKIDFAYVVAPVSDVQIKADDPRTTAGAFIGNIFAGTTVTNFRTYYLPEIYGGSTTTEEEGTATSSVAYEGNGAGSLENIVNLAYYEVDGQGNVISGKMNHETMQVRTQVYDSALRGREYPFSVWSSFEKFSENISVRGTGAKTYYGDWQPVISPATVYHEVTFKYQDPLAYAGVLTELDNMGQKVKEGTDNTVNLPPVDSWSIIGYKVIYWELHGVTDGSGNPIRLQAENGQITIPEAYCGDPDDPNDNPELVLVAYYEKITDDVAVTFYYDPTGANRYTGETAAAELISTYEFDRASAVWTDVKAVEPTKNITGYRFTGWYADPELTKPLDLSSGDRIADWNDGNGGTPYSMENGGDVSAYAKYEELEYYTITIDFMYQVGSSGEQQQLNSVPRYRFEDEASQYKLQKVVGETFDEDVKLPTITNTDIILDNDHVKVYRYDDSEPGTGVLDLANNSIHITADQDAHFIVVYTLPEGEQSGFSYVIMYRLGHTASGSTATNYSTNYNATQTYTFNRYGSSIFTAPEGSGVPDITLENLDGFTLLTSKSDLVLADAPASAAYDKIIYVDYDRKQYSISFDSKSGTYVPPVMLYYGEPMNDGKPANPTRTGFTFSKWTLSQKGNASTTYQWTDRMPPNHVVATAVWNNGTANYTVIFWRQKVTDNVALNQNNQHNQKTYDFAGIATRSGTTGSVPTVQTADTNKSNSGDYLGFTYRGNDASTKTISGNGTTVVNVYYDRNVISMDFTVNGSHLKMGGVTYHESSSGSANYGLVNGVYTELTLKDGKWVYQVQTGTRQESHEVTVEGQYTDTIYYASTSNSADNAFYNGSMITVYRNGSKWYRTKSGNRYSNEYTGTRYMSKDTSRVYSSLYGDIDTGATYYAVMNGTLVPLRMEYDRGIFDDYYKAMYEYTTTETIEIPIYSDVEYSGTRYEKVDTSVTAPIYGLFGQPLSIYGYAWPSTYVWKHGSTTMTYLGQFILPTPTDKSITFTTNGSPSSYVYFFLEKEDGSYGDDSDFRHTYDDIGASASSGNTFTFTEKYDGYTVSQYNNGSGWKTAKVQDSANNNGSLRIRYARKSYNLSFYNVVNGATFGSSTIKYGDPVTPAQVPSPSATEQSLGYTWDGKYYEDEACTVEYNFANRMPCHNVIIYVRYVLPSYTVSFDLNDPDPNDGHPAGYKADPPQGQGYTFTVTKNDSLDGIITGTDGNLLDAYTPEKDGYDFDGWFYGNGTPFINSMGIQQDMTIYATWSESGHEESDEMRDITVYHVYKDEHDMEHTIHDPVVYTDKHVGTTVLLKAIDDIEGYYAQNMVWYHLVTDDENQSVTLYYNRIEPWLYNVEYYARYSSYESAAATDVGCEISQTPVQFLIDRQEDVEAYNQYQTIDLDVSAADSSGENRFGNYHLHHYEYLEIDGSTQTQMETDVGTTLTIHPADSKTAKVTVRYYLEPDPTTITVGESVSLYDGTSKAVPVQQTDAVNVFEGPDGVTTVSRDTFRYYNNTGALLPESDVVNAGVYRLDGYVVLHVEGTPIGASQSGSYNFLLWKDVSKGLNLIINRRDVTMTSGSAEAKYGEAEDGILTNSDVTATGFVEGEGATYQFSVESFRRDVGSSENIFTYTLNENTDPNNYNIQTVYGTLTVYWEYTVETYARYYSISGAEENVNGHVICMTPASYLIDSETTRSYEQYGTTVRFNGVPSGYSSYVYDGYRFGTESGMDTELLINPQENYTATVKFCITPDLTCVEELNDWTAVIIPDESGDVTSDIPSEKVDSANNRRFWLPSGGEFIDAFRFYQITEDGFVEIDPSDITEEGQYPTQGFILVRITAKADGDSSTLTRNFLVWQTDGLILTVIEGDPTE